VECAACGYVGNSEKDFGSRIFLSVDVFSDGNNKLSEINGIATRVFVCPKCMTLKMITPEDKEAEMNAVEELKKPGRRKI
jgi:hypothetical protein